jgi:hypothetical protein
MSRLVPRPWHPAGKAAIERAALGEDELRDARPPFQGVAHAVRWYWERAARYTSPKTSLGPTIDALDLGLVRVDGGRGSVMDRELALLADVSRCLPRPPGPDPTRPDQITEPWLRWAAFVLAYRDGCSIGEVVTGLRRTLHLELTWDQARRLLYTATVDFRDALDRRGLIRRGGAA